MQEFLDLQQNQLNLEDYITRYRHLEAYCPHFYTTDGARAGKFVRGLREGLRSKVLSSRPRDLDEAVTMARCIEEDWVRTQKDHQKRAGQHSQGGRTQVKRQHFAGRTRPYERRDDRTFRRNQPTRSEATQGSVATPTSQKCPTCSRVHPGKPCYRATLTLGVISSAITITKERQRNTAPGNTTRVRSKSHYGGTRGNGANKEHERAVKALERITRTREKSSSI
ncbi:hypothetical protein EJ110_NYTH58477 [Nymphaea thermarum]|nr:hypothetical protein EJ110_NYTH58477 [Nymphaea thermarum]